MNTYYALSTATCAPDKVSDAFKELVEDYVAANPELVLVTLHHTTCSIGSPASPSILLTVQFTSTGKEGSAS